MAAPCRKFRNLVAYRLKFDIFAFLVLLVCTGYVDAWDTGQLELFDLVEEVNQNFYEFLGVSNDAEVSDIKKAYRKLSLQWHPDKNSAENAEEMFRKIVAVYEVLKDEEKRGWYADVLEHGLPDWRQPIFYFRKARKMSLLELAAFLTVLITIGQYLVMWAAYWERKLTIADQMSSAWKKKARAKRGRDEELEQLIAEEVARLPRPSLVSLLPVASVRALISLVKSLPSLIQEARESLRAKNPDENEEVSDGEDAGRERRPPPAPVQHWKPTDVATDIVPIVPART